MHRIIPGKPVVAVRGEEAFSANSLCIQGRRWSLVFIFGSNHKQAHLPEKPVLWTSGMSMGKEGEKGIGVAWGSQSSGGF